METGVRKRLRQESAGPSALEALPRELLEHVMGYLDAGGVLAMRAVCRTFLDTAGSSEIWRPLVAREAALRRRELSLPADSGASAPIGPSAYLDTSSSWARYFVGDAMAYAANLALQRKSGRGWLQGPPMLQLSERDPHVLTPWSSYLDGLRVPTRSWLWAFRSHQLSPSSSLGRKSRQATKTKRGRAPQDEELASDVSALGTRPETRIVDECLAEGEFVLSQQPIRCRGAHAWYVSLREFYMGDTNEQGARSGFGFYHYASGAVLAARFHSGLVDGPALLLQPSGDAYRGAMRGSFRHGFGVRWYRDGSMYAGRWFDNAKHGFGVYYYRCGDMYAGDWERDRFEGQGTFIWGDGRIYRGQMRSGMKSGRGSMWWADGVRYDGMWMDGLRNGDGVLSFARCHECHGWTIAGCWSNDSLDKDSAVFSFLGSISSDRIAVPHELFFATHLCQNTLNSLNE